jgi:N-acetyl-gamma-glutamyl-phosphate reductase
MVKVTVVGASGYLGGELLRILVNHQKISEIKAVSRSLAGKPVSSLHKNLLNVFNDEFVDLDFDKIDSDIVLSAAPPGDWFAEVPSLIERGIKIITLGGKFRIKNPAADKEVYGGYENDALLNKRVYGMPELYREEIKKASFVTNPGCYATTMILALKPLEEYKDKIDLGKVAVNSVSGTSGAGAALSEKTHHSEVSGNVRPYNVAFHRHTPEVESILNESFKKLKISFIPMLGDFKRGIVSCATLFADEAIEGLERHYQKHYKDEPFVRVTSEAPDINNVAYSNFCDILPMYDQKTKRIVVISAIDNLLKGGSGQAVQNMNLMLGFEETEGLKMVGGHP